MNNSEVFNRLEKLLNYLPRQKEIADKTGINQNTLSAKASRNSQWTDEDIQKLNTAFNIDIYKEKSLKITKNHNMQDEDVILDYYPDVFGSCGSGAFTLSEMREQIIVPKKAFFTAYNPVKKYSVINARGNSMEPLIFDNDKLIIEHSDGEQIIDNRPYIFCYNDEIFIKKLAKNVNQLVITSENKSYDVIKLTGDEINKVLIIGQVVGLMRDLR